MLINMEINKECPHCDDFEDPPFIDTYNVDDFSQLVTESERNSQAVEEEEETLNNSGIIKWLLEYTSTISHYMWDIPDMVLECMSKDTKYMITALKEYGVHIEYKPVDKEYLKIDREHNKINKDNAILTAVAIGSPDIIVWLIEQGSSVHCVNERSADCLHIAAENGKLKNMKKLLKYGAVIDDKCYTSGSLLDIVAGKGHLHIVKWLFELNKKASSCISALHNAIKCEHYHVVQWLIENSVSVTEGDFFFGKAAIHFAATVGNIVVIKWLVQQGAKLLAKNETNNTVVHFAAEHGYLELLKWLYTQGGNLHEMGYCGDTPLHLAAKEGHMNCIKYLVHKKCNVNSKNLENESVLHAAVRPDNLNIVQFLIQHNADIHALDNSQNTVLQHGVLIAGLKNMYGPKDTAFERDIDFLNMLKWLVSLGCNPKLPNKYSETLLSKASRHCLINTSKWLLQIGLHVNDAIAKSDFWFRICNEEKNWDMLQLCISFTSDVNVLVEGETLLHNAVYYIDAVKMILNHTDNVNVLDKENFTPLQRALRAFSTYDTVHYLLDHGADVNVVNQEGDTPLHLAAWNKYPDIVAKIIDLGADVNAKNNKNQSPLSITILLGENLEVAKMLISKGADVNSSHEANSTILKAAIERYKWKMMKLLVENGADLTLESNYGVLKSAVLSGELDLVIFMLDHGAKIENDPSIIFNTAYLHGNKKTEMLKFLIQEGADVNSLNSEGQTILHKSLDNPAAVELLLRNGADVNNQHVEFRYSVLHSLIHYISLDFKNYNKEHDMHIKYQIMQKLIKAGANVNLKDMEGNTVLHYLVTDDKYVDLAKLLVLNGADINAKNVNGNSILHLATSGEIALFLCDRAGVEINCKNANGYSILSNAIYRAVKIDVSSLNIVNLLQSRNISNDKTTSESIINSLAASRFLKYLEFLVDNVRDIDEVDKNGVAAIHHAANFGMLSLFKQVVKNGANVQTAIKNGNTILHLSTLQEKSEITKYILENFKYKSFFSPNNNNETPLHFAVIASNTEITRLIVGEVDVNCKDITRGQTALHIACVEGNLEIVKMLVAHGADIHDKDHSNLTPVQVATLYCHYKVLKYFITEINENVLQLKSNTQETLLHLAVKFGNLPNKIVESLLARNDYPIDTVDNKGNSALHYACLTRMDNTVKMLVENGAKINLKNKTGNTPLHYAARGASMDTILYLLEKGGDISIKNIRGNTVFHICMAHGRFEASKYFLQRGADIFLKNHKGNCIIQQIAVSGDTRLFLYLLQHFYIFNLNNVTNNKKQSALLLAIKYKCNSKNNEILIYNQNNMNQQDAFGNTVLHHACRSKNTSLIEKLIEKGADVNIKNKDGDTPVHLAHKYLQDLSVIQKMLDHFTDIASVNKLGWNIVHCAVSKNTSIELTQSVFHLNLKYARANNGDTILHIAAKNVETFTWVIHNCDIDINERNNNGDSVLLTCLKSGFVNVFVLESLLDHNADPLCVNHNGDTALHVAAQVGRPDFVAFFINEGINVDARNVKNNTPLHLAAQNGFVDVIEILVRAECDVHAVNNAGLTPSQIAAQKGHTRVVEYFEQPPNHI